MFIIMKALQEEKAADHFTSTDTERMINLF